jgi:tRNA (guanine26-N2/guanine27-N2)-dimethyltransferase
MASTDATMADAPTNPITTTPKVGQTISHEGKEYTTIKEGLAHILVPQGIPTSTDPKLSKEDTQRQQVFYNPIQQFNRDMTVLAIKTFGQDVIQRKTKAHEQHKKKKKSRKQGKAAAAEATNGAPAVEEVVEGAAEQAAEEATKEAVAETTEDATEETEEESASKKRKLDETGADEDAAPAKKQRVAGNGTSVLEEDGDDVPDVATKPAQTHAPWQAPFSILDALSATGLRALRFAQEIPFVTEVTANDMSQTAVDSIKLNVQHNKLENKVTAKTGNAIAYMYSYCDKKGYDVIDLDPYGTAAPFLDSAIQAINSDGMLCVTCTDSAIFASHGYLEKTYSQYGGLPFKGERSPTVAARHSFFGRPIWHGH